jgi:prepilin-type processing-associated H-X9-DG protein
LASEAVKETAKETVATELARCYTQIVIKQTRSPVARFSAAGFSLLELFLVVVIIFVVFTLFISAGSKSGQEKRLAACQNNLQNIYAALRTFSQDNNGALPAIPGAQTSEAPLSLLVPKCTTGSEFFICPGGKDKPLPDAQPFADKKISYAYYMGRTLQDGSEAPLVSDAQVDTAPKMPGQIVFSTDGKKPGNNHNKFGGNFLFCDGNVQNTPARLAFLLPPATNVVLLNPKP